MDIALVLALCALVIAVVAFVLGVVALRGRAAERRAVADLGHRLDHLPRRELAEDEQADGAVGVIPHIAVVMNPSKHADPEGFRRYVHSVIERYEGTQARFYETTREDPGYGQATQAVADGADLVIAAGGDGTVRMVAAALADSPTRMAILPVGTGNLLARNLEIPLDDVEGALKVAVLGRDKRIDVGWLRVGSTPQDIEVASRQIFLVMAGFGADAEVIGATSPTMKRRIGWIAYVLAGASKIIGRSHNVEITLPGGVHRTVQARTVLIGNVGKLPAGIVLMPDATIDNGHLEVLAMSWRSAAGLSQILTQLVAPRMRPARPKLSSMQRYLVSGVELVASRPQPVQLDGDVEDEATRMHAEVDPGALRMRVPAGV
ncbi:diacylglycerol kinase family protein [Brachybacterium huguangmaarense]|uniref:Diacylglycerol kinase family protein n=1 Tax=Brachybacterium huguangmaarense TaxID=1652028 RepID=A0ABY6G5A7_9MICO|nr:diacylglycerol kinase family protein [Brachybacterium huguangmaarense]UYG17863.1 diacylglycerol kinase family protein [Brachybacterium huguangmaarense]